MKPTLPLGRAIAYAVGQFGWSLVIGIIINYLVYFYLPPSGAGLPRLISEYYFFGFVSVIGLIAMGGRFLYAVTDPWIASLSDRASSRIDRRTAFMAAGGLPMVVLMFLVFFPPHMVPGTANLAWLAITVLLRQPEDFYSFLLILLMGGSFICYPLVNLVAKRVGKKTGPDLFPGRSGPARWEKLVGLPGRGLLGPARGRLPAQGR